MGHEKILSKDELKVKKKHKGKIVTKNNLNLGKFYIAHRMEI